ncbi:MAG: aminotransferase class I/II-fold pyridoxal phosphate-dependent enzyme [Spirochaetaceae bacterium]|jgi:threonine-phosphate decarboxylase|nr:aminotransferase class I/II-fold pyridoxal phosphate-dependent enzyme [Spirochaetaceae bacterium]
MKPGDFSHGGDVYTPKYEEGRDLLDFSSNISPLGLPPGVLRGIVDAAAAFGIYPDPQCRELRAALERRHGVGADRIVCGNGAADLIYRIVGFFKPKKALITAPTFSEYEKALTEGGALVERFPLDYPDFAISERILPRINAGTGILFLCNPNNPTGNLIPRDLWEGILRRCAGTGTILVSDECFNDFLDDPRAHSSVRFLEGAAQLIILRAFTKLYAMAGLRLGYALFGSAERARGVAGTGQPWSVSTAAQVAGLRALEEAAYVEEVRSLVRRERPLMKAALASLGLEVLGGEANYLFFRLPGGAGAGAAFFRALRDRGILIRSCANYPGLDDSFYRIAIRRPRENRRLLAAIGEIV